MAFMMAGEFDTNAAAYESQVKTAAGKQVAKNYEKKEAIFMGKKDAVWELLEKMEEEKKIAKRPAAGAAASSTGQQGP